MPNPGLSPERMALQSAYTEAEAYAEIAEVAKDIAGCCGHPSCLRKVNNALFILKNAKGVK